MIYYCGMNDGKGEKEERIMTKNQIRWCITSFDFDLSYYLVSHLEFILRIKNKRQYSDMHGFLAPCSRDRTSLSESSPVRGPGRKPLRVLSINFFTASPSTTSDGGSHFLFSTIDRPRSWIESARLPACLFVLFTGCTRGG
jgi:hypothetical protein